MSATFPLQTRNKPICAIWFVHVYEGCVCLDTSFLMLVHRWFQKFTHSFIVHIHSPKMTGTQQHYLSIATRWLEIIVYDVYILRIYMVYVIDQIHVKQNNIYMLHDISTIFYEYISDVQFMKLFGWSILVWIRRYIVEVYPVLNHIAWNGFVQTLQYPFWSILLMEEIRTTT